MLYQNNLLIVKEIDLKRNDETWIYRRFIKYRNTYNLDICLPKYVESETLNKIKLGFNDDVVHLLIKEFGENHQLKSLGRLIKNIKIIKQLLQL